MTLPVGIGERDSVKEKWRLKRLDSAHVFTPTDFYWSEIPSDRTGQLDCLSAINSLFADSQSCTSDP